MTRSRWIIFILICLGILGFVYFTSDKKEVAFTGDASKPITEGQIKDHVYGSEANKVVLIEYGDFQCPACGAAYPTVKDIKSQYEDELTFVFRNLPLTSIHPNALAAATAAEAAGLQGKYYQMHDMLYENQEAWSESSASERGKLFKKYAEAVGVDGVKFEADLSRQDIKDKIRRDQATAKTYQANSTPTFILDGKKVSDEIVQDKTKLYKAVEKALKDKGLLTSDAKTEELAPAKQE